MVQHEHMGACSPRPPHPRTPAPPPQLDVKDGLSSLKSKKSEKVEEFVHQLLVKIPTLAPSLATGHVYTAYNMEKLTCMVRAQRGGGWPRTGPTSCTQTSRINTVQHLRPQSQCYLHAVPVSRALCLVPRSTPPTQVPPYLPHPKHTQQVLFNPLLIQTLLLMLGVWETEEVDEDDLEWVPSAMVGVQTGWTPAHTCAHACTHTLFLSDAPSHLQTHTHSFTYTHTRTHL